MATTKKPTPGGVGEEIYQTASALVAGFDSRGFDAWLAELAPCNAKTKLERRRALAFAAANAWDQQGLRDHVEFMLLLQRSIRREDFLVPLARRARKHGETQAARRRDKPGTSDHDTDDGRNERIRRRHARGETYATLKADTGLSRRQLSRIINAKPAKT